jgi:hypothetical protein
MTIDLPDEIEAELRRTVRDIDQTAKEAMLVELYRQRLINHSALSRALGMSRYETDGVLKRHQVMEDLLTPAEFERQLAEAGIKTTAP